MALGPSPTLTGHMYSDVRYSLTIGFVGAILFLLVDKYEPEGPLARLLKFLILFVAGVAILHKLQPYGLVGVAVSASCFLSLLSIYRSVIRNPHL